MAKGILLDVVDVNPGADDNNVVLLCRCMFVGATVPDGPRIDMGALGNGVPVNWNIAGTAAAFSNNVEDALKARAVELGFTLLNTDCFFQPYTRGT